MFSQPRRCVVTKYEPKANHDDFYQCIDPVYINPILGISRIRRTVIAITLVADSNHQEPDNKEMPGGVLYETSMMQESQQEWMNGRIPRSAHEKQT